jgi:sphinganine-1-phosphate aldolase
VAVIIFNYLICFAWCTLKWVKKLVTSPKVTLFNLALRIPLVNKYLKKEQAKTKKGFEKKFKAKRKNQVKELPDQPWREDTIMNRVKVGMEESRKFYTNGGRLSSSVFCAKDEHWDFVGKVMRETIESNCLWASEFSGISQMEAEIIRMTLNLYQGPEDACGLCTSGGTESLLITMLACKKWAHANKGITKPNIVAPVTAHGSFDKGAFYFDIELRKVNLTKDFKVDLDRIRSSIDSNTILIVASAPDYGYGMYDPVPELASMAKSLGIFCHVDACLGSYINPFVKEAGFTQATPFDFSVDGVTSISCDPHKYSLGPKGCSVLMFRDGDLRRASFAPVSNWTGGFYVTPTLAGSRSGQIIAGTWAAIMKQGRIGFLENARKVLGAAKSIRQDI